MVDSNGVILTTSTDEPAVVVLFGRGLGQWLLHPEDRAKFRAAPHFVPALKSGKERVIFARMYVAPKEAVPSHGDRFANEDSKRRYLDIPNKDIPTEDFPNSIFINLP